LLATDDDFRSRMRQLAIGDVPERSRIVGIVAYVETAGR
jgi:hypothetical protein